MNQATESRHGEESIPLGGSSSASAMGLSSPAGSLKRRASLSCENLHDANSKRSRHGKENSDAVTDGEAPTQHVADTPKLVDELEGELLCGCCSELVYRPVVVLPCQHFFCGSCCVLWIKNGGSNCPACRSVSSVVIPCQPIQKIVDAYLRAAPFRIRAERERIQADELYKPGTSMRIPSPRQASPEPNLNLSREYIRPCPHCAPGNPYGWICSQPIPDPNMDLNNAWHADNGTPPGHAYCGNCENILASNAPTTSRCDFCLVAFCGIAVQGRCCAPPLRSTEPHGFLDVGDLIQSPEVYRIFDDNMVEAEYLFDHLTSQRITPKLLFDEIISHYQSLPNGFQPMFNAEIFVDMYPVDAGTDSDPAAPRRRCCRMCAAEILLFGLYDWWVRQRQGSLVDDVITSRPDCPDGRGCSRQREHTHAKDFNHVFAFANPVVGHSQPIGFVEGNGIIPIIPAQASNSSSTISLSNNPSDLLDEPEKVSSTSTNLMGIQAMDQADPGPSTVSALSG